jgi:carbamoyl-phosphate synthase large subunit
LCADKNIDIIVPLVTAELYPLALHLPDFKQLGAEITISDASCITITIDKALLFETLKQQGIIIPAFKIAKTPDQLKQAIYELGYPEKTVCFKPTLGDGSRGFHILDDSKDRIQQVFYEKHDTAYISTIDLFHILRPNSKIPELLVMEYLPNEEYSVDILADHGQVIVAVPRLRERVVGGITVAGTIVKEQDVIAYCSDIVRLLGLHGNIGIQVRRDEFGSPKLLKVNPRLQGTTIHCTGAGINLPFLGIKLAKGWPITKEELNVHWGTKMVRYWEEVFYFPSKKQENRKGSN